MILAVASLRAEELEPRPTQKVCLSPTAMVAAPNGKGLYIACATTNLVLHLDPASGMIVRRLKLEAAPSGLTISADGTRLYATCGTASSRICEIDAARGEIVTSLPAGHSARSPVISPDGKTLYVCGRFDDCVSAFDLPLRTAKFQVPVPRQPVSLALSTDGQTLLVAHHLPEGRADTGLVAATVSVIDLRSHRVVKHLDLPNGSSLLREIRISPDGRLGAVTHNLARYQMPTTQAERGWINTGALTLLDIPTRRIITTMLLDNVDRGAANPWALTWTADGKTLAVSHAGTHELSLIDVPSMLAKLQHTHINPEPTPSGLPAQAQRTVDVQSDLSFLVDIRRRIGLSGCGPRALAVVGSRLYAANYFTDTIDVLGLDPSLRRLTSIPLGPTGPVPAERRGEMLFNDATLSFQDWQSCASCHSDDGRVDGLNWDLLNDGIGNPKNTRSLVWAPRTPPAMSTGVRETAATAVRSGLAHILFAVPNEDVAGALDRYLESLQPLPSPMLEKGRLSAAASRGKAVFLSSETGCAVCHAGPFFTDLKRHDVGTAGSSDQGRGSFDTPALVELWRTAPYLHDGSCESLIKLLTERNPLDRHGRTKHLSRPRLDDLVAYLMSL